MKNDTRPRFERKKENIAVLVMILLCIPVLFIYFSFFKNAFFVGGTGAFTLDNFRFLYEPIVLGQRTVQPIGQAFTNTVIFTAISTVCEVVISCMAGYALARMEFTGKRAFAAAVPRCAAAHRRFVCADVSGGAQYPVWRNYCGYCAAAAGLHLYHPQLFHRHPPGY